MKLFSIKDSKTSAFTGVYMFVNNGVAVRSLSLQPKAARWVWLLNTPLILTFIALARSTRILGWFRRRFLLLPIFRRFLRMLENKVDGNGEVLPSVGIFSVVYTSNHFAPLVSCDLSDNSVEEFKWNPDRTELVSQGKVSLQERIQASAKGLTVYEILDRALRGDVSAQREF